MRQPKVARLLPLLLAALLVVPIVPVAAGLVVAGAFLVEFLSDGARRPLSALTAAPRRAPLAVPGVVADRWATGAGGTPLVLVHGYAPAGKDDARVRAAAALLARSGFDVAVPTIPGLTGGRLRPDDAAPVVATLTARPPAVLVAVSVGSGPALLAAAEPAARDRVRVALVLGGYASAAELLRFFLTGDYAWNGIRGHVAHDPAVVGAFIEANADLLDAATRARIAADPAGAAALLAAPPPALEALLARLSPLRVADRIRAPLVLVHGYDDPAVPYTESLRLAAARPARTRVVLVRALAHVEGAPEGDRLRALGELARLLLVFYGLGRAS